MNRSDAEEKGWKLKDEGWKIVWTWIYVIMMNRVNQIIIKIMVQTMEGKGQKTIYEER